MANMIGPLEITYASNHNLRGNRVSLAGSYGNEILMNQLRELFRLAPGNVSIAGLLGGVEAGYDPTPDSVLTQYCSFDSTKVRDGWYALLGFSEEDWPIEDYWPFSIELAWLGTDGLLARAIDVQDADELTNSWGI